MERAVHTRGPMSLRADILARLTLAAAALALACAGCAPRRVVVVERPEPVAAEEVVVVEQPPVERVEVIEVAPAGHVWVKGHWRWHRGGWVWEPGHWERERLGFVWEPGHWERRPRGWLWIEGHWRR